MILSVKRLLFLFAILISFSAYSQKKFENKFFAEISGNTIVFKQDTLHYKQYLAHRMEEPIYKITRLRKFLNPSFEKVEIKKESAIGSGKEYYILLLSTKDKELKIARCLEKRGDLLFLNSESEFYFEEAYAICFGDIDCFPIIYENEKERKWQFHNKKGTSSNCKGHIVMLGAE